MPLFLGVNIDHIATLRQARYAGAPTAKNAEPCPVQAAQDAILGGADLLTIHVRGDRRHMLDEDAYRIREEVKSPLNFEMAVTEEMVGIALKLKPDFVCLVPENRMEVTTEGGLNVVENFGKIRDVIARLQDANIQVSLFIDPNLKQVEASAAARANMVELHTGAFANAADAAVGMELARLIEAAKVSHSLDLQVNAGHGINYTNIVHVLTIPHLTELNIGHSIIARSTRIGLMTAVREMKELMSHYPA